jgi:hypothetical protein
MLSLARIALADPTPTELQAARDLFSKAMPEEDAGQWSDALDKLRRAGSVKMTPGIRYHIALCEEKLGMLVAALSDYAAADQAARDTNNKDVLDAVADPLKNLRIRVPTLTIEVPPADGVEVELDGKPMAPGLFGLGVPVEPGLHRVVARAKGKRAFTTQVELHEREAETATVKWIDVPVVRTNEDASNETPETPEPAHGGSKAGAIVMTITAAAALGFGIGAYVAADGAHQNLATQCPMLVDCSDLRFAVHAWDTTALVSWIASAGAATIAIVLWVSPSHDSAKAPAPRARVELRPGGFALSGTF